MWSERIAFDGLITYMSCCLKNTLNARLILVVEKDVSTFSSQWRRFQLWFAQLVCRKLQLLNNLDVGLTPIGNSAGHGIATFKSGDATLWAYPIIYSADALPQWDPWKPSQ